MPRRSVLAMPGENRLSDLPQLWPQGTEARGPNKPREGLFLRGSTQGRVLPSVLETDAQRTSGPAFGDTRGGLNGSNRLGNHARRLDRNRYPHRIFSPLHYCLAAKSCGSKSVSQFAHRETLL